MTEHIKINLPKVKLRFKTAPAADCPETSQFKEYGASPCVFMERLRMGKQIKQSYLKFRKLKKNNYLKHFSSQKKNVLTNQAKKINKTMIIKKQHIQAKQKFQLTLDCCDGQSQLLSSHLRRKIKDQFSFKKEKNDQRNKSDSELLPREEFNKQNGSIQKSNYLTEHISLRNSQLKNEIYSIQPIQPIQLLGTKCHYVVIDHKKQGTLLRQIKKKYRVSRDGSSSFKIDPWKDHFYQQRHQYQSIDGMNN